MVEPIFHVSVESFVTAGQVDIVPRELFGLHCTVEINKTKQKHFYI